MPGPDLVVARCARGRIETAPAADAVVVPALDRSFAHGVGVFETVGVWGGRVPLWAEHLERMWASAEVLGIGRLAELRDELCLDRVPGLLVELLARSGLGADGIVRVTLSPGGDAPHLVLAPRARPADRGVARVRIAPGIRRAHGDPTAVHKTTSRALWEFAVRRCAGGTPPDDVLLLGAEDAAVLEGATGCVFVPEVRDGATGLATPPLDGRILPGVGRAALLGAARRAGVPTAERPVALEELGAGFLLVGAARGPRAARLVGAPGESAADRPAPDPSTPDAEPPGLSAAAALWQGLVVAAGDAGTEGGLGRGGR